MSTLQLNERFTLDCPRDLVWRQLTDPMRTVTCLPGAEITGQEDERSYTGSVKVKVGSVTVSYRGTVVFEEVDGDAGYLRVVGKGRERSGGSAEMTMESRIRSLDDGSTEVTVDSDVRLTGKIVRFGRGMIESISTEIFREFRTRLERTLAEEICEARAGAASGFASDAALGAGAGAAGGPGSGAAGDPSSQAVEVGGSAPGGVSSAAVARGGGEDEALALLPLLFRSFRGWLRRLFGRA